MLQHEAKIKTLTESQAETEKKKRALEQELDKLRATSAGGTVGSGAPDGDLQKQMALLRDEIAEKQKQIDEFKVDMPSMVIIVQC